MAVRKEYETVLNLLVSEVVEADVDQVLMISRSDESHWYFLSKGRVKKAIPFEKDITHAIVEHFSQEEPPVFCAEGRRFSFECTVTPDEVGECLSVTIREVK